MYSFLVDNNYKSPLIDCSISGDFYKLENMIISFLFQPSQPSQPSHSSHQPNPQIA